MKFPYNNLHYLFIVFICLWMCIPSPSYAIGVGFNSSGYTSTTGGRCSGTAAGYSGTFDGNLNDIPTYPADYYVPNKYCITVTDTPSCTTQQRQSGTWTDNYTYYFYNGTGESINTGYSYQCTDSESIPYAKNSWYASIYPTPQATITLSPTSINAGQTATLGWSTYPGNFTSCTGTNFSTGGATSGSVSVSPSQTTTYSISCTYSDGNGSHTATDSKTLTVVQQLGASTVSCSVNQTTAQQNALVTWTANVTAGAGTPPYSYLWNGDGFLSAKPTSSSPSGTYTSGGKKYGMVTVKDSSANSSNTTYTYYDNGGYQCTGARISGADNRDVNDFGTEQDAYKDAVGNAYVPGMWNGAPADFFNNPQNYCVNVQVTPQCGNPQHFNGVCYYNLDDYLYTGNTSAPYTPSYSEQYDQFGAETVSAQTTTSGPQSTTQQCTNYVTINSAPNQPTLTCPATGIVNQPVTFTVQGTDPDGDPIKYGMDWNGDGTVDTWSPSSGTVSSGTSQSPTKTWTTAGSYIVQALAQDSNGNTGTWSSQCTVAINSGAPVLTATLPYTSTTTVAGVSVSLPATIYNNGSGATGKYFYDTYWLSTSPSMSGKTDPFTYPSATHGIPGSFESGEPGGFPANYNETIGTGAIPAVTYNFPSTGTYYLQVCADQDQYGNSTIVTPESNNCSGVETITVGPASPTNLQASCNAAGNSVNLTWSPGTGDTGGYMERIYDSPYSPAASCPVNGTPWQLYTTDYATCYPNPDVPQASNSITNYSVTPGQTYTWWIHGCVSAGNCSTPTVSTFTCAAVPDLEANTPTATSGTPGATQTLSGTVFNSSSASASAPSGFHNIIQVCDNTSGTYCGAYDSVNDTGAYPSSLAVGATSAAVSASVSIPTNAGTYYYRICADETGSGSSFSHSSATEGDTTNNCSAWSQLQVTSPTCMGSPTSAAIGQTVTWTAPSLSGSPTYSWSEVGGKGTAIGGTTNSSFTNYYSQGGSYTVALTYSYGSPSTIFCTPVTVPSPAVTLTTTPDRVTSGTLEKTLSFSWTSTSLTDPSNTCSLTRNDGTTIPGATGLSPTGSYNGTTNNDTNTITKQTIYTITCSTGTSAQPGTPVTSTSTVNIVPSFTNF